MTRQKKELIKAIKELEAEIEVDRELSHGMAPAGTYDEMEEEIWRMQDELARLQHYKSYEDKMYDPRFQPPASHSHFKWECEAGGRQ